MRKRAVASECVWLRTLQVLPYCTTERDRDLCIEQVNNTLNNHEVRVHEHHARQLVLSVIMKTTEREIQKYTATSSKVWEH